MAGKLLILPFDHRGSLAKDLLNAGENLTRRQKQQMKNFKNIIYQGFVKTVKQYADRSGFGVLVDEEFGRDILKKADRFGVVVMMPVEASGRPGLQFDYGDKFGEQIKRVNPDYVKVLIRYNPLNCGVNRGQLKKLQQLNDFCQANNYRLVLELLVPPAGDDLNISGSEENYDKKLRLLRTQQAIKEISRKVQVDVWKLEWFSRAGWREIAKTIGPDARIIMLGRGGNKQQVKKWLADALTCKQVIGLAIGRTIFLAVLKKYHHRKLNKKQAVDQISKKFDFFVKMWQSKRK